jgi:SHS2 domain-containing protein
MVNEFSAGSTEKPYRILDHEADIGFEVYGKDEAELFVNAATTLFSLITDLDRVETKLKREVTVSDGEVLLVVFLNELLYVWDVERFIPKKLSVLVKNRTLHADLEGEILDPERHSVRKEIKAVTYHKFAVQEDQGAFRARVYLDI